MDLGTAYNNPGNTPDRAARDRELGPSRRDAVARIRQQLNLTQEQFAAAVYSTTSSVNRWENGHAVPHPACLAWALHLARARGFDVTALAESIGMPEARCQLQPRVGI